LIASVGNTEPGLDHPAVFPLALAEQLIRTFSQTCDLVLDNFCGSGQTLLAAKGCGRRYLGDRAGSEVRQDCSGAATVTSMIDKRPYEPTVSRNESGS